MDDYDDISGTYFPQSPVLRILRHVGAWVGLVLVMVIVVGLVGRYRAASEPAPDSTAETTATATPDESIEETATVEDALPSVEETETDSIGVVVVLQEGLNFRASPSTGGSILRKLRSGERLELLATEGSWHHVRDAQGTEGYVSSATKYTMVE